MTLRFRNRRARSFAYRKKLWQSRKVEATSCEHTISHVDADGYLQGTWTSDYGEHGTRIVCDACGKFYGYLREGTLPPVKRPPKCLIQHGPDKTGSSSCSDGRVGEPQDRSIAAQTPAATDRKATARSRRPIDFAALRRQVSIADVLELVEFSPVGRSGSQVRGPCPIHKSAREKSRIFSANLNRNIYQCFKRACGSKGNQLDLYAAVTGLPIYEAALELCQKLGIDVPWKEIPK